MSDDITQIDFKRSYGKIRTLEPGKQKVFYTQDGIEYDSAGKACNAKQVKDFYAKKVVEAQAEVDAAKESAAQAQAEVDAMMKQAGLTKTAVKKAAT